MRALLARCRAMPHHDVQVRAHGSKAVRGELVRGVHHVLVEAPPLLLSASSSSSLLAALAAAGNASVCEPPHLDDDDALGGARRHGQITRARISSPSSERRIGSGHQGEQGAQ